MYINRCDLINMEVGGSINFSLETMEERRNLLSAESSMSDGSGGFGSSQMCVFCSVVLIIILLFNIL